jgi:hypothetical protein
LIFIFIFMFALSTIAGNSKHLPHGSTTPLGCPLPPLSSSQTTPAGHQPIIISLFLGSTPIREPPSSVRGFQLPSSHSINQPNPPRVATHHHHLRRFTAATQPTIQFHTIFSS